MKLNRANLAAAGGVVRTQDKASVAKERIVHIGLGAFARAHQAWYTSQVDQTGEWGIVAFTGRTADMANQLNPQDGLFTLITRGAEGDSFEVIDAISRVCSGDDWASFSAAIVSSNTALVTLTITEAGYRVLANGHLDTSDPVVCNDFTAMANLEPEKLQSALARLAYGLNLRRLSTGLGLALVSCDNLPANGQILRAAMTDWFAGFGAEAVAWLETEVSFVSTSVDRITPRTTESDVASVQNETGWNDASPVVTEPFTSWILQGDFPLGRPAWENAGAQFVDNIEHFENRKLWLLNGSHSLLAYAGQLLGHTTVAEAIADSRCRKWVETFWDEAQSSLTQRDLNIHEYREALLARFENARIEHLLAQIAADGATKLRVRVAPVALAELAFSRSAVGCATVIAAWIAFVIEAWQQGFANFKDSQSLALVSVLQDSEDDPEGRVRKLINVIEPRLAAGVEFTDLVSSQLDTIFQNGAKLPAAN